MEDHHKMRAWDKKEKCYWYLRECGIFWHEKLNRNMVAHTVIPKMELEQCTGLKDKNEILVYENDNVKGHMFFDDCRSGGWVEGEREFSGTVSFDVELSVWGIILDEKSKREDEYFIPFHWTSHNESGEGIEITGTIHDKEEDERTN